MVKQIGGGQTVTHLARELDCSWDSVAVIDSTGMQHLYTSGGSGWTPPPGENATPTHNAATTKFKPGMDP